MQKIECEILGLSSSPSAGNAYALLLKEVGGNRRLPIIIGTAEAQAIAMVLEGINPPRPITHDLMKSLIENLGANLIEIVIYELRENTFFAKLILEQSSLTNEIDCRPSDAIALAIRVDAPIFVMENVLDAASFSPSSPSVDPPEFDEDEDDEEPQAKPQEIPRTKEAKISALQDKLREALENEDYERAAKLRDEIERLSGNN